MANLAPQTELRLFGNVPLDKGYKNCVYIGNYQGCVNDFVDNQLMTFNHHLYTLTEYTYFREDRHRIRVKMKADDLWAVNYLCYKNPIMGGVKPNKWFFGFVDETVYVNNEVTDIYFTPDIMTTWWEEANIAPCYVERMHEPNDEFGKNLTAEPVKFGDYKYAIAENSNLTLKATLVDMKPTYTLVPYAKQTKWNWITGMDYGAIGYDGVVSGYTLFCFNTEQLMIKDSPQYTMFVNFMNNFFNVVTDGKRLLGLFTLPQDLITDPDNQIKQVTITGDDPSSSSQYTLPAIDMSGDGTAYISKSGYALTGGASLDGYVPANLKMYTAPFCTCEVLMPNGDSMILRHEYMTEVSTVDPNPYNFSVNTAFRILRNIFPPISIMVRPSLGYASADPNSGYDSNTQLEYSDLPVGSWTWGIFEKWVAQQFVPSLIDMGLMAASLGGAMNLRTASTSSGVIRTATGSPDKGITKMVQSESFNTKDTVTNSGVVSGVKQAANFGKECYNWLTQTPASRGRNKSTASFACSESVIEVRCLCPNRNDAERIDRFLSAYGYTQDKVMQPMRNVRARWTYLQTNDCLIYGDMPSGLCQQIAEIYNNGVTFWHNLSMVGRYDFTRGGNDCLPVPAI